MRSPCYSDLPDEIGEFLAVHRLPIALAGTSFILFVLGVIMLVKTTGVDVPIEYTEASRSATPRQEITVDVEGAVRRPGIYRINEDQRVDDVIGKAGGFTETADTEFLARFLNRAARLTDGAKIYIPQAGEGGNNKTTHNNGFATSTEADGQDTVLLTPDDQSQNNAFSNQVSINTASQSELESLSGIGPVTAEKIIRNRPYTDLNQLVERKVISASLFGKLQGKLAL